MITKMKSGKTAKRIAILYWFTTILIFLFEGVMPALTSQSALAKEGIRHLGYPEYFGTMLVFFKVAGALALVLPKVPNRIKEWAYAGFAFDFIAASVSHYSIDGIGAQSFFPLIVLGILAVSYVTFHKRQKAKIISDTEMSELESDRQLASFRA